MFKLGGHASNQATEPVRQIQCGDYALPGQRDVPQWFSVIGHSREWVLSRSNTDPLQLPGAFRKAAPGPHHSRWHHDHCSRFDVDDVSVKTHLALSFEEDIDLFEDRVHMPIARLLTGFIGVCCQSNDLTGGFVVYDPATGPSGVGAKAPHKVPPRVQRAKLCDAVVSHRRRG